MKSKVFSVTQINTYIKRMFQSDYALRRISIKGQVSNCKYHSSGHIYFSLKDEESQISCVMFASARYNGLQFELEDGQEVIVDGNVSVYERGGSYQLYAQEIRLNGIGELYVAYEMLKQKLYEEGLFDHEIKKPIPKNPKKIGVVTARTGAAIHDIISTAKRRNPYVQLVLYPAKVQGEGASDTIVSGIRTLDQYGVDTIIIGRGGGSIEDLWAFNEPEVIEAVFSCNTPVISAVGHETDFTITDFVADLRVPTPSAAAECAVFDMVQVDDYMQAYKRRLRNALDNVFARYKNRAEKDKLSLQIYNPINQIYERRQRLIHIEDILNNQMTQAVERYRQKLSLAAYRLDNVSPLKKFDKGYSYVENNKQRVQSVNDVSVDDLLTLYLKDGTVTAKVTNIDNV